MVPKDTTPRADYSTMTNTALKTEPVPESRAPKR